LFILRKMPQELDATGSWSPASSGAEIFAYRPASKFRIGIDASAKLSRHHV
jgi:hypothetical protein